MQCLVMGLIIFSVPIGLESLGEVTYLGIGESNCRHEDTQNGRMTETKRLGRQMNNPSDVDRETTQPVVSVLDGESR